MKAAWAALWSSKDPLNQGHRYGIVIGDSCYMADAYAINPYDGYPSWFYDGIDGLILGQKMDGWILKDFKPGMTLKQFKILSRDRQ
jgi:hypothetical protein